MQSICEICALLNRFIENQSLVLEPEWKASKEAGRLDESLRRKLKYCEEVEGMMWHRGLWGLATRDPTALYRVAQYRPTRNDRDRVHGIQQVFGFRLGASDPALTGANLVFSRFLLENQLGEAILKKFPVLSQLHVYDETVELGCGWRVSPSSRVQHFDIGM